MEAPIILVQTLDLKPGYSKKYDLLIDLHETQYQPYVDSASKALIDFLNEDGRFGNLDEGEYTIRFTPLKVEVLVK